MSMSANIDQARVDRRSFMRASAVLAGAGAIAMNPTLRALASRSSMGARITTAGKCLIGAHVSPRPGETPEGAIEALEGELGRRLGVDRQYYHDEIFPTAYDQWTASQGRIPAISFKSYDGWKVIRWAAVAAGEWDDHLNTLADSCKAFGGPMFLTFFHEPENDSDKFGTPAEYVAAWRHVVDVFRAKGATNVRWATCLMGTTYWNPSVANSWYPGEKYVDYIGADAYNWGPSTEVCVNNAWTSFRWRVERFYSFGLSKSKPMVVLETGCSEDPENPGRKAAWIRGMRATLKDMPRIKVVCWFQAGLDTGNKCEWWVDSSDASRSAMTALIADPYFIKS